MRVGWDFGMKMLLELRVNACSVSCHTCLVPCGFVSHSVWNCCHLPKWWVGVWRGEQMGVSLDGGASYTHTHSRAVAIRQATLLHSNFLFNNHDSISIGPQLFRGSQHDFTWSNEEQSCSAEPPGSGHCCVVLVVPQLISVKEIKNTKQKLFVHEKCDH